MAVSRLRDQLDAARRETDRWPEWKRKEIEAEVRRTPLRIETDRGSSSTERDQRANSRSPDRQKSTR
jgi:hypothetical protein